MARKQRTARARKAVGGAGVAATALRSVAIEHLAAGRFAEAETAFARLLRQSPRDVEGRIARAEALRGLGKRVEALALLREVTGADPACAEAHYRAGLVLQDLGRRAEAEFALRDAVASRPGFAPALIDLSTILLAEGRQEEAAQALRDAIAATPGMAVLHYNLGNVLRESGRLAEAVAAYSDAIVRAPSYADAHFNLALTLRKLGRNEAAAASYSQAAKLYDAPARALNNLGTTLRALRRHEEAKAAFRAAIAADPAYADPYYNLGNSLRISGETDQAAEMFHKCVALQPGHGLALVELSRVESRIGRLAEAEQMLLAARSKTPRNVPILIELAHLVRRQGRVGEAAALYGDVLRVAPATAEAQVYLVSMRQQLCDWRARDQDFARLTGITRDQFARGGRVSMPAFDALAWPFDEATQLAVARSWSEDVIQDVSVLRAATNFSFAPRAHPRLRIGYISQDFRNQAMGHLTRGMYRLHDRDRFEIHAYSVRANDHSRYRKDIEAGCEHFLDVADWDAADIARRINADEIDILVDMMGHTEGNRMAVMALRPAPVQVGYLRFPGSSGAAFLDYMLSDPVVTPPSSAPFYIEKLVRLPHCYQVNDSEQRSPDTPVSRTQEGLPEDAFVYCSFNNSYKIEPSMFDVWMRVLTAVPGSVLWLLRIHPEMEANLKREAAARAVDPSRLVFSGKTEKLRHLARHRLADLFLDTRYYTAHTTASDAMVAGVPIITHPGDTFAARVTASMLKAIGLDELIFPTLEAYEAAAVALGRDPARVAALKAKVAANRPVQPLFDTARWVRNVERAYRLIWDNHAAGHPPRQIDVVED